MRITKLSARNLKGQSFDESLAPITLITGLNSTGKTARVEALSLAALGYVPAEPRAIKSGRDIFDLYGSSSQMAVGFDTDGDLNVTRMWKESGGSVKYAGPDGPILPAVGWDPSAYLSLSGPERLRFMCKATAKGDKFDQYKSALGLMAEIKNIKLEKNTPLSESMIKGTAIESSLTFKLNPTTVAEWVDLVLSRAKEKKATADQNVKRMRQTVQGLAQARSETQVKQDAEIVAQAARKALKEAETERTRIATLLEEARGQYRSASRRSSSSTLTSGVETDDMMVATIERLKPIVEGPEPVAVTDEDREAVEALQDQSNDAIAEMRAQQRAVDDLLGEKEALKKAKKCDKCGHEMSAAEKKKASLAIAARIVADQKILKEWEKRAQEATGLFGKANKSYDAAVLARQSYLNALAETKRCQDGLKESQAAAAELPALKEKGTSLGIDLVNQDGKVAEAKAKCDTAEKDLRELIAFRADAAQRARVIEQAEQAEAEAAVAKAFVDIVVRRQEEIIKEAVGPLVSRMNEWCGHLLPFPIRYEDGELRTGQWTHRTSSDSEKLLIYAALSFAMASDSPIRIAIISRFESFDYLAQRKLLATADKLITEGKLDQCILVEVRQREEDNELGATNFDRLKIINVRTQNK